MSHPIFLLFNIAPIGLCMEMGKIQLQKVIVPLNIQRFAELLNVTFQMMRVKVLACSRVISIPLFDVLDQIFHSTSWCGTNF